MAPKEIPCAKYQYVVTPEYGPKIIAVESKDEESAADYNYGGYLPIKLHDSFKDGRYKVVRKLGWGHFSTVWLIKDNELNRHSALKVVKSAGRYTETARDEIRLLRKVMAANPCHPGRDFVVSFLDSFQHVGPDETHFCIVFEPLGENLLALIERNKAKGVPHGIVKAITKQILLGLQYLHEECDLVHTDIKPENIMISIPDVEALIQAELSSSPSPRCRRVGVPPSKPRGAGGVTIPKKGRERHVHIFDSQPLPSPTSRSSSPSGKHGLRMSQIKKNSAELSGSASLGQTSGITGLVGSAPGSAMNSASTSAGSSMAAVSMISSTPPTSIESAVTKVDALLECRDESPILSTQLVMPKDPTPTTGPSLLAQTAPSNLKEQSTDTITTNRTPVNTAPTEPICINSVPVGSTPIDNLVQCTSSESLPPSSPTETQSSLTETQWSRSSTPSPRPSYPLLIKIADLGNATPSRNHFTEDIQTRQYRAPEAILGRSDWDHTADIWSVACVIFELLTAEYLFDPQSQGEMFSKDDDHMAQIIELLGDFSNDLKMGGRYSREIFDSHGHLRYIKSLKPWPLKRVMVEKYLFTENDAEGLCSLLEPMLRVDFRTRATAGELVDHPWLCSQDDAPETECF